MSRISYDAWREYVAQTPLEELDRVLWMLDAHGGMDVRDGWVWANGAAIMRTPGGPLMPRPLPRNNNE